MKPWIIPRAHEGRTVAVLASGSSMNQRTADALHIADVPCIAVNTTYKLAPWAWALYAADVEWWIHPGNATAHQFEGLRISCQSVKGVHMLRNAGVVGYSDAADCVHTFGNSGAQAIQIAVKSGARRVLLFGFDMHGEHWHGKHPQGLRETAPELYERWISRMASLAPELERRGVEVVNCTPGSALACFVRSTMDSEIGRCVEL